MKPRRREILRCAQNDMFCNSHKRNDSVMPAPDCDEADVRVGQTFLSADVRPDWEDAAWATRPPRIWAGEGFRCTSSREDGRFFAALRMTRRSIIIAERHPLHHRPTCHPEEAVRPGSESLAGRLTKDLLRHRYTPARSERVPSLKGGTFAPGRSCRGGAHVDGTL